MAVQSLPGLKIGDWEILIGGVGLAVGQGEAEQQGVGSEDIFERLDDRDATAFANEGWFAAVKGGAQGGLGGLAMARVRVHGVRLAAMAAADGQGDGGWSAGLQPGLDLREQHRRVLIGDEAEGEFGKGTAW